MRFKTLLLLLYALCGSSKAFAQPTDAIVGTWLVGDGTLKIQIYKSGGLYAGKIVWCKNAAEGDRLDVKNPVDSLRTRPLMGSNLFWGLKYDGDGKWSGGRVYDSEDGGTYNCYIKLESETKLEFRGYAGLPVFGQSDFWTKP